MDTNDAEPIAGAGVYAVRVEGTGLIKIGHTANIKNRWNHIQTMNPSPVEVIAFMPEIDVWERETIESTLHQAFAEAHVRGEWFDMDDVALKELAVRFGIEPEHLCKRQLQVGSKTTIPGSTRLPGRKYIHHVSFRLNDTDAVLAHDLRMTFEPATFSEAFRWVMSDPVIVERIKARIRGER